MIKNFHVDSKLSFTRLVCFHLVTITDKWPSKRGWFLLVVNLERCLIRCVCLVEIKQFILKPNYRREMYDVIYHPFKIALNREIRNYGLVMNEIRYRMSLPHIKTLALKFDFSLRTRIYLYFLFLSQFVLVLYLYSVY